MFIGIHAGLTYTYGFLLGKSIKLKHDEAFKLAALASIYGILPDVDYFIQLVTGFSVHRYVAHSFIIGLGICTITVLWKKQTKKIVPALIFILIMLGIITGNKSILFISFSFAFLLSLSLISYYLINPRLPEKIIFIGSIIPYMSHVIFDAAIGGSAAFFPIFYAVTGKIYWLNIEIFSDFSPFPKSFWLLELIGAVSAILVLMENKKTIIKKYQYTLLQVILASLIFYQISYNYLELDLIIALITVIYVIGLYTLKDKINYIILGTWSIFCTLYIFQK